MSLTCRKAERCRLEAFADASNAGDEEDRRSVGGIVTKFGGGAPFRGRLRRMLVLRRTRRKRGISFLPTVRRTAYT